MPRLHYTVNRLMQKKRQKTSLVYSTILASSFYSTRILLYITLLLHSNFLFVLILDYIIFSKCAEEEEAVYGLAFLCVCSAGTPILLDTGQIEPY